MARPRRKKTAAKVAPKTVVKDILDSARALREDASPVIPEVEGGGLLARSIRREARGMRRVADHAEDEKWLRRHAKRPTLSAALAATLLLAHTEKVGHAAQMTAGTRDVLYVQRGRIPKEFMVSMQYFDDPELRLFAYRRLLRRRPLVAYATKRGVVVQPFTRPPPRAALEAWGLESLLECRHRDGPVNLQPPRLELAVKGSEATFYVCRDEHDEKLLARLMEHTANLSPRLLAVRVAGNPLTCAGQCPRCHLVEDAVAPHAARDAQKVLSGREKPEAAFGAVRRAAQQGLEATQVPVVVGGDRCFGEDRPALLEALTPDASERSAVASGLEKVSESVHAEDDAPNKLLAALWPQIGGRVVPALAPDREAARRVLERTDLTPREMLAEARRGARQADALAGLPRYRDLPAATALVDEAARAFRVDGNRGVLGVAQRHLGARDDRLKPVLFALFRVAGEAESRRWQFSKDDMEHAEFLAPNIQRLLDASPEAYDARLREVHALLGEPGELQSVPSTGSG